MNIDDIQKLARVLNSESLGVLEVQEGDTRIRLEAQARPAPQTAAPPVGIPFAAAEKYPAVEETSVDFNAAENIPSPMVGVFYSAASPGAKPYVAVGDNVKKGDVLCIIEAMKLMNEITAETSGHIVDICVSNGDVVEYGQTLFKIMKGAPNEPG